MRRLILAAFFPLLLTASAAAKSVIVVDAGSSGTRVYRVKIDVEGRKCSFKSIKRLSKSDQALATSNPGTLREILDAVSAEQPKAGELEIKAVGTGGFRRLDAGDSQECGRNCSQKRAEIQAALAEAYPNARLHVASGEEEAKLGWVSVAALTGESGHAVIDSGGSTVELAVRTGGALRGLMANIGARTIMESVRDCDLPVKDYKACAAGVERFILDDSAAQKLYLSETDAGTPVVALGGGFNKLAEMLEDFSDYHASSLNPYEERERLESLARSLCSQSAEQLVATGKISMERAPILCGQLALELLLIKRFHISRVMDASIEVGTAFARFEEFQSEGTLNCQSPTLL